MLRKAIIILLAALSLIILSESAIATNCEPVPAPWAYPAPSDKSIFDELDASLDTIIKYKIDKKQITIPFGYYSPRPRANRMSCLLKGDCDAKVYNPISNYGMRFEFWMSDLSYPKLMPNAIDLHRCEEGRDETDYIVHVHRLKFYLEDIEPWSYAGQLHYAKRNVFSHDPSKRPYKVFPKRSDGLIPFDQYNEVTTSPLDSLEYLLVNQNEELYLECQPDYGIRACGGMYKDKTDPMKMVLYFPAEKLDDWRKVINNIKLLLGRWVK